MSTYLVPGRLDNVSTLVGQVAHRMRSCGVCGQEASFKRDEARRDLAAIGFLTFIENGKRKGEETFCVILPTPHFVEYPAVNEIPAVRATVTGFSLSPSKDWAVVEYFAAQG